MSWLESQFPVARQRGLQKSLQKKIRIRKARGDLRTLPVGIVLKTMAVRGLSDTNLPDANLPGSGSALTRYSYRDRLKELCRAVI